jgi:hypothetical protein
VCVYGYAAMAAEGLAYRKNRTTFSWEFFCVALPGIALVVLLFKKARPDHRQIWTGVFE